MIKYYIKDGNQFVGREGTNEQIKAVFEYPIRSVYTAIQNLTADGTPLVEGQVLNSGSIQVNGSSALRRTVSGLTLQVTEGALAHDYNWVMKDEIRIYQGISNQQTNNQIWYFNLGAFVLSSFSASENLSGGTKLNISAKDKMVLLNGEQGGKFAADIELHIQDNFNGTTSLVPIPDIIHYLLDFAGIPRGDNNRKVIIDQGVGRELLEYRGTDPLYLFINEKDEKETVVNYTYNPEEEVTNGSQTKLISELDWGHNDSEEGYTRKITGWGKNSSTSIVRVNSGEVAGYKVVPLTYPGELKAAAGETITTVLDKIVNVLGKEYEYFFDIDGKFWFQKKKALLSITRSDDNSFSFSHDQNDDITSIYTFDSKFLLTSLNRQPKIENIKNDFTIWGEKKAASSGQGVPIHARYIIDEPFKYYDDSGKETTAVNPGIICEQLYQMASRQSENLIPEGKDYYKKLFPDILSFWRDIYNPNPAPSYYSTDHAITTGSMKPTHWFGTDIPNGYENDYDNIYIQKTFNDEKVYVSWGDTIDLSKQSDIFDANGKSLYDKTGYKDRAVIREITIDDDTMQYTFYTHLQNQVKQDAEKLPWTDGSRIKLLQSYYYRENGKSGYKPLYNLQLLAFAKAHFDEEIWNNQLTLLLYTTAGSNEYTLVRSVGVETEEGITKYSAAHSANSETEDTVNNQSLSTILNSKIIQYQSYANGAKTEWKTVNSNGQFFILQPNFEAMPMNDIIIEEKGGWNYEYTIGVNLKNYYKYSFYKKITEQEYQSWLDIDENFKNNKNQWLFVTGYDQEKGNSLVTIAPLDTITYKKTELYKKENGNLVLLTPDADVDDKIYLYPASSSAEKIKITGDDDTSFITFPCDWKGGIKTEGVTSKTKYHPVFAYANEYNTQTHIKLAYEADPSTIPFELIWITPNLNDDELNNYKICDIGDRPFVKTEKVVTSLQTNKVAPLYFTTSPEESNNFVLMNPQAEKVFVLSTQGASAEEYIKNLLFEHLYCNETANTTIIPLYFLEPNNYITITENDEEYHYILSSFSIPLSYNGTMNLTLIRDKLPRNQNNAEQG